MHAHLHTQQQSTHEYHFSIYRAHSHPSPHSLYTILGVDRASAHIPSEEARQTKTCGGVINPKSPLPPESRH
jgi:hypothetical protein